MFDAVTLTWQEFMMGESLPATLQQAMLEFLHSRDAELIASKMQAYYQRRGRPKSETDWRTWHCSY
jgi:hypothetical protein